MGKRTMTPERLGELEDMFAEAQESGDPVGSAGIDLVAEVRRLQAGHTDSGKRLAAAAPELLAACEAAAKHHQGHHSEVGRQLRAAIAKATGEDA